MKTVVQEVESCRLPLSPAARIICQKIQNVHPDFMQHIKDADTCCTDGKIRKMNTLAAQKFKGNIRGCIWFHDPVTQEILLEHDGWLAACMNETIWLPLSVTFPQLRPCVLTGAMTRIVSMHVEDIEEYDHLADFFRDNGDDILLHRCLKMDHGLWLVFFDQETKRHVYRKNYEMTYDGVHKAHFFCRSKLVPILQTVEWRQDPLFVTGCCQGRAVPSTGGIPEFLVSYFIKDCPQD